MALAAGAAAHRLGATRWAWRFCTTLCGSMAASLSHPLTSAMLTWKPTRIPLLQAALCSAQLGRAPGQGGGGHFDSLSRQLCVFQQQQLAQARGFLQGRLRWPGQDRGLCAAIAVDGGSGGGGGSSGAGGRQLGGDGEGEEEGGEGSEELLSRQQVGTCASLSSETAAAGRFDATRECNWTTLLWSQCRMWSNYQGVLRVQAEELAAAKGIELPADFLAEASAGGLRRSALEGFAALQVGPPLPAALPCRCKRALALFPDEPWCLELTALWFVASETGARCVALAPGARLPRPPHRGPPLPVQGALLPTALCPLRAILMQGVHLTQEYTWHGG